MYDLTFATGYESGWRTRWSSPISMYCIAILVQSV